MSAAILDRIEQGTPVMLPATVGAATVASWWIRPGQMVNAGDTLATVAAGNMRRGIVASVAGRVRALMVREGGTVAPGGILAYIEPDAPPQARQSRPERAREPQQGKPKQDTTAAPMPVQRPTAPPTVASNGKGQEGSLPSDPKKESGATAPAPMSAKHKPKQAKRERTKHRGFYILPSQEKQLKRLVADLSLDEEKPLSCNDSLLVRAAIDLLTTLPAGALRATVEAYKQREALAKVGSGWPRPGKP